jgi:hypothetical protein
MQVEFVGDWIVIKYDNTELDMTLLPGFVASGYRSKITQNQQGVFLKKLTLLSKKIQSPIPIIEPIQLKLRIGPLKPKTNEALKCLFSEYLIRVHVKWGKTFFSSENFDLLASWMVMERVIVDAKEYSTACDDIRELLQHMAPLKLQIDDLGTRFDCPLPSVIDLIWKCSQSDFSSFPNVTFLRAHYAVPISPPNISVLSLKWMWRFPQIDKIEPLYKNGLKSLSINLEHRPGKDEIANMIQACPDLKLVVNGKLVSPKHMKLSDLT